MKLYLEHMKTGLRVGLCQCSENDNIEELIREYIDEFGLENNHPIVEIDRVSMENMLGEKIGEQIVYGVGSATKFFILEKINQKNIKKYKRRK